MIQESTGPSSRWQVLHFRLVVMEILEPGSANEKALREQMKMLFCTAVRQGLGCVV
jgi:hypothetical protein